MRRAVHDWRIGVVAVISAILLVGCGAPAPATKSGGGQPPAGGGAASGAATVSGDAANGRQLFQSKGCIACHVAPGVPGATGTIGPNLTGIGNTERRPQLADGGPNTPAHLKQWIQDPGSLKPGTMMPNLNLSDKEANDLTAFLLTLR